MQVAAVRFLMRYAALRQLARLLVLGASLPLSSQQLRLPDAPEVLHIAHPSDRFPEKWYRSMGDGTDVLPAPVLDRSYIASVENTSPPATRTSDAWRKVVVGAQVRDSLGRTRSESENGGMTFDRKTLKTKIVLVSDPVAHCQFHWTEFVERADMPVEDRVAFVECGPQTLRYKELDVFAGILESAVDGTTTGNGSEIKTEHLLPLQIDGLSVQGLRVSNTRTDEHGQARTWVTETWYSPELKELIRQGSQEFGYSGLTDIRRKEPDPGLFYPPETYRIELRRAR